MRITRGGRLTDLLVGAAAVLIVGGPMFFTRGGYSQDFTNSLWLIWVAGHHFGHSLWPSYFLNVNAAGGINGIFNPEFAFYGGPLYAFTGALSALLANHAAIAYAAVTALALSAAYGGCWWLARLCGVRGLLAHIPALVMLTGSYYSTDLYGRGAWAEFVALSSIPLVVASAADLLLAKRWRVSSVLLLTVSVVAFTGSHNITLEWGVLVLGIVAACMLVAYRPSKVSWQRVLGTGFLALLTAGVNGWFLLPDIAYAGHTAVAASPFNWSYTSFFDNPGVLLYPLREVPPRSTTPALYVQAPVWFMLWALIAGAWLWRDAAMRRLRRAWAITGLAIGALLLLLCFEWPWVHMPHALQDIQFAYRASAYVLLLAVPFVIVGLLAMQRLPSRPGRSIGALWSIRTLLVQAVLVSVALCVWQLWVPSTTQTNWYRNRDEALVPVTTVPTTWYSPADYADNSLPLVSISDNRVIDIDARSVDAAGNRVSADVDVPPGPQPIATNILGGPYLVDVSGLRVVGRTADNQLAVVRLHPGSGRVHVVISTRTSRAVVLGRAISLASVLAILALVGWLGSRSWRERRARGLAL